MIRATESIRGRARRRSRADTLAGLLWTAPWWLGFVLLLALPLAFSLYISFCDYPLLQPPVFAGLENYKQLARDPTFGKVVANTALFSVVSIPLATGLAILLAILLHQPIRGRAFFRACLFVPTIVPLAAAGLIWMWMFNPEFGPISAALRAVGATPPLWLGSPRWAMASLVIVSLWIIGSPVVIYLAALGDIPRSLYEAARIDGAGPTRQFWHISLPGLSPVILFNVIVGIIGAWQVFALPYLMWRTQPGPDQATYFYTMYLFDNAFIHLKMGYASAMAWIQLLIVLALTGFVFWASRKMVHYRA